MRLASFLLPLAAACLMAGPLHAAAEPDREAALGLVADYAPEYSGASRRKLGVEPVVYLRWGRFSVSTASGFVNRSDSEVLRGLGVELLQRDAWRLTLGLRYDRGRQDGDSGTLAGLGGIRATVRARVAASWRPAPNWRLKTSWSVDALGRDGGHLTELSVAREWRPDPAQTWTLGLSAAAGDSRYLQNHYGVTVAQAERTGFPVYLPGAGWRDAGVSLSLRQKLGPHWVVMAGAGWSRKLGPTRASPLVREAASSSVTLGAAYSF